MFVVVAAAAPVTVNVEGGGPWEGIAGSVLQAVVIAAGGAWAVYLFGIRGAHASRIRVGIAARLERPEHGPVRLFIKLHVVNETEIRSLNVNARVRLWSVRSASNEFPRFTEVLGDFPMDYAYGDAPTDGFMSGDDGSPVRDVTMTGLECIESELLFSPDPCPDLLALRASFEHLPNVWWRRGRTPSNVPIWETFVYVDPLLLKSGEYAMLTSHED